jgi:pyruvate dehydrogenase E2 component (dihydrolipoamide acetyltransferase)
VPFAGAVTELLVPEGATVDVGTPILHGRRRPGGCPGGAPAAQAHPDDLDPPLPDEG